MNMGVRRAWRKSGWIGACLMGLSLSPLGGAAVAQTQSVAAGASGVPGDALAWLTRIQQAAATSSYHGTLMFSAGGVVSSTRVLHYGDGRQRYERLEVLDGRPRVQYRHNDLSLTLWPTSKVAMVEPRDPVAEFPALPAMAGGRALEHYELRDAGRDRVAGHDVEVLVLKPRDKHRFAQRLWADRETGLLLRNDVLAPNGDVLESSAFTDVQTGVRAHPEAVLRAMKKLEGYRVVKPQSERTQLDSEGWSMARPVPGFQLVSCTRRLLDAAAEGAPSAPVLQTVYSDGLAHVSVFIEPFDPMRHKQPMGTSLGATHTLMNRKGDWWITVVGEVPMATVQQFEAQLERKR